MLPTSSHKSQFTFQGISFTLLNIQLDNEPFQISLAKQANPWKELNSGTSPLTQEVCLWQDTCPSQNQGMAQIELGVSAGFIVCFLGGSGSKVDRNSLALASSRLALKIHQPFSCASNSTIWHIKTSQPPQILYMEARVFAPALSLMSKVQRQWLDQVEKASGMLASGDNTGQLQISPYKAAYPWKGLSAGFHIQESEASPPGYEVFCSLTVLVLHRIHHLSFQHGVAPHQPSAQLPFLSNFCDHVSSVSI